MSGSRANKGSPSSITWFNDSGDGNTSPNESFVMLDSEAGANQRMKLTGAAILVLRGMKVLQAAPAAYPYR